MRNTNFAHEFRFDNLKYYKQQSKSETNKIIPMPKELNIFVNPIICDFWHDIDDTMVRNKLASGTQK